MQNEIQQDQSIAYVIDDDAGLRDGIRALLRSVDIGVETFGSTNEFLRSKRLGRSWLPDPRRAAAGDERA